MRLLPAKNPYRTLRPERGAALVVGLLLLLVLTMLALAGMNSATVEFIMAGNEQYRQNAFQAAETGISQAVFQGTFNPGDPAVQTIAAAMPNSASDAYSAAITRQLGGAPQSPAMWTGSLTKFSAFHFEIQSTGTSARNGTSLNTQGIVVIAQKDQTFTADTTLATTQLQ